MSVTNRLDGLASGAAIKVPCRTATTAAITLSGEQTVDGVAVVTGDRVLVKDQADATQNGIYAVDTGDWDRAADFDGNNDIVKGTLVYVTDGATTEGYWRVTSADPITIDTDDIDWEQALSNDGANVSFIQSGTGAVARTVQAKERETFSVGDFGAVGDGVTDDTAAIQAAVNAAAGGGYLWINRCPNYYKITATITGVSDITIRGTGAAGEIRNEDPAGATDVPIFTFSACSNFSIDNVHLRGSAKAIFASDETGSGIFIVNCSNWAVRNCSITYMTTKGIYVVARKVGGVDQTCYHGDITGNYLNNNGTTAANTGSGTIGGADIQLMCGWGVGTPADVGAVYGIKIGNNRCVSATGLGISVIHAAANAGSMYDINIFSNEVANKKQHGILAGYSGAAGSVTFSVLVEDNTVRDCAWMGIYSVGEGFSDLTITGNRIVNCCTEIGSAAANAKTLGTGTSWAAAAGGTITYYTTTAHNFSTGVDVIITGSNPAGYNSAAAAPKRIATVGTLFFTCTGTGADPGAWVAGGSVQQVPPLAWAGIGVACGTTAGRSCTVANNDINNLNGHSGVRLVNYTYSSVIGNNIAGNITTPQAQYAWYDNGVTLQDCAYSKVANNTVRFTGVEGNGIYLDTQSAGGGGALANVKFGNSVLGNTVYNPSSSGIHARMQGGFVYDANQVFSPVGEGIFVGDSKDGSVTNNVVHGIPTGGIAGIKLMITATIGDFVDRIKIANNKLVSSVNAYGIWLVASTVRYCTCENNDLSALQVAAANQKIIDSGTNTVLSTNRYGTDTLTGTFTMAAAATKTVNNNNMYYGGTIPAMVKLTPTNAAAAVLMAGGESLYVPAGNVVSGTSFQVNTAAGGAAAGTETFQYDING